MKPTLIFDGDCNFCRRWVARWKRGTGDRVTYKSSHEAAAQFPQVSAEKLRTSVQLVESDGVVFGGAEAVFRTLTYVPYKRWMLQIYQRLPIFRWITEKFYAFVASHRIFFSYITRLFWGAHLEPPTYGVSAYFFIRLLGVFYLIAFLSFWVQMPGLVGSNGILPAGQLLELIRLKVGVERFWLFPTLAWIGSSDAFLTGICIAGVVFSAVMIFGLCPIPILFFLWMLYLSIVNIGQEFFSFQWDVLLLEVGFLGIFLLPFSWIQKPFHFISPPGIVLWLHRWLLFRLIFRSGIVKLASRDPAWWDLTALNFHYETQPLPTWVAWYAHQLPGWIQKLSVAGVFLIEILLPFFIFMPRRLRLLSCFGFVALQFFIMVTGNYCFFNLLTLGLCLFLIDDWTWFNGLRRKRSSVQDTSSAEGLHPRFWPRKVLIPLLSLVLMVSSVQMTNAFNREFPWPLWMRVLSRYTGPFHSINGYGLFAVMTKKRMEIVVEGSNNGYQWFPYEFKWKPGLLNAKPRYVAPHQPRLDWQMWFAALGDFREHPWFINFLMRLLEGSPQVLDLLKSNPFPDRPPRYIHALFYRYQFTNFAEKDKSGEWWKREKRGLYAPEMIQKDGRIVVLPG